ncbi:MAG: hypothetical protein A2908_02185 [Candidatus Staskawiczbacteria bacterium RIFCSPLOWO2_01_FULL_38_12b]|uniref:Teneurin-like YD-shell domain-containing protein n=1 Tax=Candidatus Staskawiczbacteria bacterium RIFCSPLOWO2_01_FULL_38_12b TaxID=1802214 RepID=A0A1G2IFJ0_9BACT|nr:MAG: hypothetical protein A2908_02185 [Candidatus Staskawiczbacteria bacterium RIFCSPLOWO2_01_FULL_38_12b]
MSDYAYDSLYRITSATITGNNDATKNYTENYTYDPIGNILTKTLNGVNTNYTYAGNTGASFANPHAVTQIGDQTFSYDQNGNLISDGTSTYAFNPKNQLIKVTKGTTVINYTYDSIGQRISKSQGASFTLYPNKSYNVDSMGKTTVSIFAPWGMVANIETLPDSVPKVYTFATDHLQSVQVTTDSSGVPVEIQDYGTFGGAGLNDRSSTFDSQRKYIGEQYDTDTELNYLNARYYNSVTGKFISQDPVFLGDPNQQNLQDPQSLNSYSYANNNPIRLSDPTGKFGEDTAMQLEQSGFMPLVIAGSAVMAVNAVVTTGYIAYQNRDSIIQFAHSSEKAFNQGVQKIQNSFNSENNGDNKNAPMWKKIGSAVISIAALGYETYNFFKEKNDDIKNSGMQLPKIDPSQSSGPTIKSPPVPTINSASTPLTIGQSSNPTPSFSYSSSQIPILQQQIPILRQINSLQGQLNQLKSSSNKNK